MARKDAGARDSRGRVWKVRITLIVATVVVIAACLAVRSLWGPRLATAERPITTSANRTRSAPANPAARGGRTAARRNSAGRASSSGQPIKTMAVVNNEQITRSQLATECVRRYGEEVLESLINKQLIIGACQARGISITKKDIHEEIGRIARKFGLTADRWLTLLQQERGIAADKYRDDIVWPTVALRRLAADEIRVTRDEINQAIESEVGPKVRARMISLSTPEEADRIRRLALAKPEEFGVLAKNRSQDKTTAAQYGWIPPIRRHLGDPEVERVAFALEEGEISEVLHVANQHIILKCEQKIDALRIATEHEKQVENRIVEHLKERKMRTAAAELFKQLQQEVKIVIVFNNPQLQNQMPGVAATVGGASVKLSQLYEECISRHGHDVLEGEINRKILMQELKRKAKKVVEADIDAEIARAADSYGYWKKDGSPDIDKWLKEVTENDGATVELYVRDAVWPSVALKKLVSAKVKVTKEDLQRGFEANYGERAEVLMIVLNNQRHALDVWELAQNNPTETFFGQLAYEHSADNASRWANGKVPPIHRHSGQPNLEKEAFRLKTGEVSGIINVADKHVIMYGLGRTKPVVSESADVREELTKDIHEKKLRIEMAKEFDRLKEEAQIDNFLAGRSQSGKRARTAPVSDSDLGVRVPFAQGPRPTTRRPSPRRR